MFENCWNWLFRNICKMLKTYTLSGKIQGKRWNSFKRLISSEKINVLAKMQNFKKFGEFFLSEFGDSFLFPSGNPVCNAQWPDIFVFLRSCISIVLVIWIMRLRQNKSFIHSFDKQTCLSICIKFRSRELVTGLLSLELGQRLQSSLLWSTTDYRRIFKSWPRAY